MVADPPPQHVVQVGEERVPHGHQDWQLHQLDHLDPVVGLLVTDTVFASVGERQLKQRRAHAVMDLLVDERDRVERTAEGRLVAPELIGRDPRELLLQLLVCYRP